MLQLLVSAICVHAKGNRCIICMLAGPSACVLEPVGLLLRLRCGRLSLSFADRGSWWDTVKGSRARSPYADASSARAPPQALHGFRRREVGAITMSSDQ